jgi:hypothetical protein
MQHETPYVSASKKLMLISNSNQLWLIGIDLDGRQRLRGSTPDSCMRIRQWAAGREGTR